MLDDATWFRSFPLRQARIREPIGREAESEFETLGPHDRKRRRIIVWRAPADSPMPGRLIPLPFLLFADETVENEDRFLMPVIAEMMSNAAKEYGMSPPQFGRA